MERRQPIRLGIYDLCRPGGSTRYLEDLIPGLPAERFEIFRFPPVPSSVDKLAVGRATNKEPAGRDGLESRLWRKMPQSLRLAVGLARETWGLRRQLRSARLTVLHCNYAGFEYAPIAGYLAGIRNILAVYHNLPSEQYITAPWLQRFVENLSGKCVTKPVAVSDGTRREWEVRCPSLRGRMAVVYNGINLQKTEADANPPLTHRELGVPDDVRLLAVTARLHPMKGIRYLLQAMPDILAQHPKTHLLLVGDGPERAELTCLRDTLGLKDFVHFLGWRNDVPQIVRACDIVVLPSVNLETFGYSLVEAMALEKPTVVTDVGGLPEVVDHGRTGFVVPRRDSPSLAKAVNNLLANRSLAEQFGRAGRIRAEQLFRLEIMQEATRRLYEDLVN